MCCCTVVQFLLENRESGAGRSERGLYSSYVAFQFLHPPTYSRIAVIIHVVFEVLDLLADVLQPFHQLIVRELRCIFQRECLIR